MSNYTKQNQKTFNTYTKGGYKVNRNGCPICNNSRNILAKDNFNYHYNGYNKIGKYRPTVHNLTII